MASKRRRLNDGDMSLSSPLSSIAPRRKASKTTDISDLVLRERVANIQKTMPNASVQDILLALELRKGNVDDAMEVLLKGSIRNGKHASDASVSKLKLMFS